MLKKIYDKIIRKPYKFWKKWRNKVENDIYFKDCYLSEKEPDLFIVVGAESSATRLVTEILVSHPNVLGEKNPKNHEDLFDNIWSKLDSEDFDEAKRLMPRIKENLKYITRRSVPHALKPGTSAHYFEFPPLKNFLKIAKNKGFNPLVLVTVRSPIPNLLSWKNNRASADSSLKKSLKQYQSVYPYIFHSISLTKCQYYIIPHEAIMLDSDNFLHTLFELLNLDVGKIDIDLEIKTDVNQKYYKEFIDEIK